MYKHVDDYYFCCYKSNFFPAIPHEIRKVSSKFRLKMCKDNGKHYPKFELIEKWAAVG